ncbi:MAG: glycosyltransferase family 4 protein [Chlamydiae bacterium]|nr:glycosyltransferase family 4 protein [Chlamydiota bacterium]MBI3266081.1 glycosyltransferase family 4 protein [Chlamydiota bacterium]
MKIAIDARWIIEKPSGIGQYTINMIRFLMKENKTDEYFLFFSNKKIMKETCEILEIFQDPFFHLVLFPHGVFSLSSQIFLPLHLKKLKIDIFHSPNFMIPLFTFGTRLGVTLHDLIPFLFPHFAPRSKKSRFYKLYRLLMFWIVKRVHHVFVDSEHSYQDLVSHFPNTLQKTSVLKFGIDPSFEKSEPSSDVEKKLNLTHPMILCVGRQDPYKNLMGLVKIFHRLLTKLPHASLVLAGPCDERYPELFSLIQELGLEKKVILTDFLSQAELVGLYQLADLFVMPSLYEGFGLPVLEAFSAGVPAVVSNRASLPEVAGEAGILLDPQDSGKWVETLEHVLKNEEMRKEMIKKGYAQLKKFSWETAAQGLIKTYEELVKK